jgi:uncharacterized membrane protein YeaQ/YmgE (transglycosylase-associated protein family)
MTIDNKISFIAGWFLTTATTITAIGIFKAAVLGLVGGFFGLFGKEMYFYVKAEVKSLTPKVKAWVHIQIEKLKLNK